MASRWKKAVAVSIVLLIGLAIFGYIIANLARPSIEQEVTQRAIVYGAKGRSLDLQIVPASQFEVGSAVTWPFVTVGYYAVPFYLHATVHAQTYLVLPWGKYVLSNRVDHLL